MGLPLALTVDPAEEHTSNFVRKFCHQVGTTLRILEESTQWANRAELYVGLLKEAIRKDLRRSNCPLRLRDFCLGRRVTIHNLIPRDQFQLQGSTTISATFGRQGDISNVCGFDLYEWVNYLEDGHTLFPYQREKLGRVLGPFRNEGNQMAQAVLTETGNIVPRRTIRPLNEDEINSESEREKRTTFKDAINLQLGDSMNAIIEELGQPVMLDIDDLIYEPDEVSNVIYEEDPVVDSVALYLDSLIDALIHQECKQPLGEISSLQKSNFDDDNILIDFNDDSSNDDTVQQYRSNLVAQNLYDQVDIEGYSNARIKAIADHRMDDSAVSKNDYIMTKSGKRRHSKSTAGWYLLVEFTDNSFQWLPLRILKESNPIEVSEFAFAHNINDYPVFKYWVSYT